MTTVHGLYKMSSNDCTIYA